MDEDRAEIGVPDILQHGQQVVEVVPVDGADIVEAELLEQRAAGDEAAGVLDGTGDGAVDGLAEAARQLLPDIAQLQIGLSRGETGEIGRHGAHGRRDRHVVVVEDDDEPLVARAGVVHRLIGHAGRHGAVTDHGDDVVLPVGEVAGDRHAEAGRDRRRGMGGAEGVVLALRALGETGETAALSQRADAVAPAGEDLVRIGLVADVPDDAVGRRVEHVVQRRRQLDHAEAGAQMPARHRHRRDGLGAQLVGDLLDLMFGEPAEIGGNADRVEKRRAGAFGHSCHRLVAGRAVRMAKR